MSLDRPALRRLVRWAAWTYLGLVVLGLLAMRFIGEDWWVTGMALYFPRILFLAPWFVFVPLAISLKLSRVLWSQLLVGALVWFPLMGFVMPRPRASAHGPQIRLLSYNVNSCHGGQDALAQRVLSYDPDVVLFQEVCPHPRELVTRLRETYPVVHAHGQFLLASRFPVSHAHPPGDFDHVAIGRAERFARYALDTPLGPIAVYNLHPLSPRFAFYAARGMRVRTSLRNGTLLRGGAAEETLRENFDVRERQLSAAVRVANAETTPRVLAGDTNLPNLSPLLRRYLGNYQDGFETAGWGFGYTYPVRLPWMRIDRVFASKDLRFVSFQTGCEAESDHRCVIAQLERAQ